MYNYVYEQQYHFWWRFGSFFTQNTVVQLIKNVKIYKQLKFALVKYILFTYNYLSWLYYIIILFKSFVLFFFPNKLLKILDGSSGFDSRIIPLISIS